MAPFFSKKRFKTPPFPSLEKSPIKDQYFCRLVKVRTKGEQKVAVRPHPLPPLVLDEWGMKVFRAANGQKTVKEFVHNLADQYTYTEPVPDQLDKFVLDTINVHVREHKTMTLLNKPAQLPAYLRLTPSRLRRSKRGKSDGRG